MLMNMWQVINFDLVIFQEVGYDQTMKYYETKYEEVLESPYRSWVMNDLE